MEALSKRFNKPEEKEKKHGVHPVETFMRIDAVQKNGRVTFIIDHVTRYLVDLKYVDKVLETASNRAMQAHERRGK